MDQEKLEKESPEHIRHIWTEFHADEKQMRVSSVLDPDNYARLSLNAAKSPLFVLPLLKDNHFETPGGNYLSVVMQMQLPYVLMTPLVDYQALGDGAAPFFTLVHYKELSDSKGLVLCRGDIMSRPTGGEGITVAEARKLMVMAHIFYTNPQRYELVHKMNHDPAKFSFEELVKAVEDDPILRILNEDEIKLV